MKRQNFVILGTAMLFLLIPAKTPARGQSSGEIPSETAQAFAAAGLPVLRQRISPVDFSAELLDGTQMKLSDLKGRVVFLNFWATWCGPCRQEMPSMEVLYQRFKGRGLEVLAVNCQEGPREVAAFMRNGGLSFMAALDPSGAISGAYGITAIPATFILDREGQIITRIVGSLDWNDPKISAAFETLLRN